MEVTAPRSPQPNMSSDDSVQELWKWPGLQGIGIDHRSPMLKRSNQSMRFYIEARLLSEVYFLVSCLRSIYPDRDNRYNIQVDFGPGTFPGHGASWG